MGEAAAAQGPGRARCVIVPTLRVHGPFTRTGYGVMVNDTLVIPHTPLEGGVLLTMATSV